MLRRCSDAGSSGYSIDFRAAALAWSHLEESAKFQVDMTPERGRRFGKPQNKEFRVDHVKGVDLAAVSHGGGGKHGEHESALPLRELVSEEHDAAISSIEARGGEDLHFEQLIADGRSTQQGVCGYGKPADGDRGWWPVVVAHFWSEARDRGLEGRAEVILRAAARAPLEVGRLLTLIGGRLLDSRALVSSAP